MLPLLKLPLSAVTVCVIASLFTHVTVAPTVTLTVLGENAIFFTETVFGLVVFIAGALLLLQAKNNMLIVSIVNRLKLIIFFILNDFNYSNLLLLKCKEMLIRLSEE